MTSESTLPLRPFGKTGLKVTSLCVGCAPLGNMPETFGYSVSEEQALDTLRTAFASPINYFDTAASYGRGESERRIGVFLKQIGGLPPHIVLGTKADRDYTTGDFSGEQIKRSIDRSFTHLGLDKIQVMLLHDPEHSTFENIMQPGGAVDIMQRYKEQGVIGHIGIGAGPIDMMLRYVETGAFEAVMTHNRYTLLNRAAEPLLDLCAQRGLALMNAAPYGSGILAKGPANYPRYAYHDADNTILDRAFRIQAICDEYNVPIAAAALQFSLRDPRITSTVIGMSRPSRIQQTIELATHPIPEEMWARLEAVGYDMNDPENAGD